MAPKSKKIIEQYYAATAVAEEVDYERAELGVKTTLAYGLCGTTSATSEVFDAAHVKAIIGQEESRKLLESLV